MPRASCGDLGEGSRPGRGDHMALVIRNTTIVTLDAARTVHHDASIVVDADRIVAIGPAAEIDRAWPHNAAMAARRAAAPPIQALAAAGCNIAMGTDNMAEDMLEAMRTGLFVERISRQDGERPWPEDVLEWGTRNGAAALGWGGEVGRLEVGKKADLIILDARRPHI